MKYKARACDWAVEKEDMAKKFERGRRKTDGGGGQRKMKEEEKPDPCLK